MNHPEHWSVAELQELGEWKTGSTPRRSREDYWDGDVLWVSPKDMKTDRIVDTEDRMTQNALEETNSKIIPPGSLIMVTRSGILEHSFPVAINEKPVTINQDLKALIPSSRVSAEYLYYCLRSNEIDILKNCTKDGTTVASINSNALYAYQIPIAPFTEQERLVTKIEELLSKIDSGVAELENVQSRLQVYKKVKLSGALEGRLSEKSGRKIGGDIEIVDSNEVPDNAPELPSDWEWVRFETVLSEPLRNGKSAKKSQDGIRTLTLSAVTERDFSEQNTKITEANPEDVEDLWLRNGDLLIERSNTEEYVGLPAVYRGGEDYAIYPDLMIRARFEDSLVVPEYADYVLLSPFFRNYLRNNSKGTSGSMPKINQSHLRNMPFPLPPIQEQQGLIERLDHIMSVIDKCTQTVETEIQRSHRLRQSILRHAFEGNLVPQDLTDEPAEELLESGEGEPELAEQKTISEVTSDVE